MDTIGTILLELLKFALLCLVVVGVPLVISYWVGLLRLVIVQEATTVAFKYLGRLVYCAMEFTDHHFDIDGSIVSGPGPRSIGSCWCIWRIGGWVFYIHPLVKPTNYADQNDPDNFGEGIYVRLGDITPEPFVTMAETADPENIGLNISFVSTMRVVNPRCWLFLSPKDVNSQVVKRLNSVLRAWVKSGDQNHAQGARGNGKKLWDELVDPSPGKLNCQPIFDEIKNRWGLEILKDSIIVEDVGYDPEYQAALKARSQAELVAEGDAAKIGGPINLLMDQWVDSEVAKMGTPSMPSTPSAADMVKVLKAKAKVLKALKADGSYDRQMRVYKDLILADGGNLGVDRIEVGAPDGTPLSGNLGPIGALAALFGGRGRRGGGSPGGQGGNPGGQGGGQQGGIDQAAEAADAYFKHKGAYPYWDPLKRKPNEGSV